MPGLPRGAQALWRIAVVLIERAGTHDLARALDYGLPLPDGRGALVTDHDPNVTRSGAPRPVPRGLDSECVIAHLGGSTSRLGRRPNERHRKFSVGAWEDEFEQLWLDRHEARAPVEPPSLLVALLDDDLERSRPLRNRITLCVGEQPVPDATLLVAGHDEQLLDYDRPAFLAAQGDVAGRLTLWGA